MIIDFSNESNDFTIYYPLKNNNGIYQSIPYSFFGILSCFSNPQDLMNFLNNAFYSKEQCDNWCNYYNKI